MPLHIAYYGYQSKPASLLQGIHFNTTALLCPLVLLKTQNRSNIEPSSSLDNKDAVHAILVPNTTMSLPGNLVPSTPMPPDDTLAGSLAYTLPPATGFPEIQGWMKLGMAINLSNLVEHSREVLSEPKCLLYTMNPSFPGDQIMLITDALTNAIQGLTRNVNICLLPPVLTHGAAKNERDVQPSAEPFLFCLSNITTNQKNCLVSQQCWSTDAITFFIILFNPKPLTYITIIHKLTHPDTEAGARGVSGVVKMAIHDSPEVNAFIAANCDALSSSLSPEQAVAVIVNSVMIKKLDLIVTGGQKEQTWAIYPGETSSELSPSTLTWPPTVKVSTTPKTSDVCSAMVLTTQRHYALIPSPWVGMDQSPMQWAAAILLLQLTLTPSRFLTSIAPQPERTDWTKAEEYMVVEEDTEDREGTESFAESNQKCTNLKVASRRQWNGRSTSQECRRINSSRFRVWINWCGNKDRRNGLSQTNNPDLANIKFIINQINNKSELADIIVKLITDEDETKSQKQELDQ
ncbi:hypothetical protein F5146DRAFT_1006804 [Armillaria mellea]|nr:hypothetical protein F5146DRAFT_1006804 [Armillaria mellea]